MNCEMNCEHAQNERLIDFKYIIKCQHVSLCTSYISIYICLTRSAYKICAGVIAECASTMAQLRINERKAENDFSVQHVNETFVSIAARKSRCPRVSIPISPSDSVTPRLVEQRYVVATIDKRFIVRIAIHTMRAHAKRKKLRCLLYTSTWRSYDLI